MSLKRNKVEQFVHSSVTSESLRFTQRIEKFSRYVRQGFYSSPDFQNERTGTRWNLLVYVRESEDADRFIDIRLRRKECNEKYQFAEAKLSVIDCLGITSLSGEKQLYFMDQEEENYEVLAVTKERMFDWCGLNKLLFMSNDTLTLQCEIVFYQDSVHTFDQKEDFQNSVKGSTDHAMHEFFQWSLRIWIAMVGLCIALYFFLYFIAPIAFKILAFVLAFKVVGLFSPYIVWLIGKLKYHQTEVTSVRALCDQGIKGVISMNVLTLIVGLIYCAYILYY